MQDNVLLVSPRISIALGFSSTITFSVWVDGQKRWESGLMTRADPARRADIDVTAAKTLELVVGDGGNGIACDHADWADARLLH